MKLIKVAIAICLFLSACVPASLYVQLKYTPEKDLSNAAFSEGKRSDLADIKIIIFDERADKSLGVGIAGAPVYVTGINEWAQSWIASLSEFGNSFSFSDGEEKISGWLLKVGIKRISCRTSIEHVRYAVSIRVGFYVDEILVHEKFYYGTDLYGYAWGKIDEEDVLEGFNNAMKQLLVKLELDISAIQNIANRLPHVPKALTAEDILMLKNFGVSDEKVLEIVKKGGVPGTYLLK